jgi:hypothetical protein
MNDLELLRKYEPIARYTQGEMFFPCDVEEFVKGAGLWITDAEGEAHLLVPEGELDVEKLATFDGAPADHSLHLRFAGEPLKGLAYQRWRRRPDRVPFLAAGRLARVSLWSRIADSFFDLSLLVRGTVPGGFTAAAETKYRDMDTRDSRRVYFGRVVRGGGWTVLQYLFFFTMNNWRSGFYGVNDHEADWEQIFVYVYENEKGETEPGWVAMASHDFKGDDLRRRWDDPLLVKEGDHPVIFAGAGSHASYFEQGEYLIGIEPEFLKPLRSVVDGARTFWNEQLGQGRDEGGASPESARPLLNIPHIDYARGDGLSIGPGQDEEWTPILISDEVGWVDNYRGLWGLDTRDPIGGERAPAGPKYNRNGTVRQSWFDPLGWAGMDKVLPPPRVPEEVKDRITGLEADAEGLERGIEEKREAARELALEVEALRAAEHLTAMLDKKEAQLKTELDELRSMEHSHTETSDTIKALKTNLDRIQRGDWGPPAAHIRHVHHPEPPPPPEHRIVESWAAISGALAFLALLGLLILRPPDWLLWALAIAVAFGAIEAATRRRLVSYLLTVIVILAVIALVILVIEFWRWLILLALIGLVVYMILDNLRELRQAI